MGNRESSMTQGKGGEGLGTRLILAPLPGDYPNRLRTMPDGVPLKPTAIILVVLVLLSLLPRVWVAVKIPSICPDGVFYIRLAQAIDQGDMAEGIRAHGLNTFPLILAALHRLGLGWELAGNVWGVVISSLAVLPLYGWVRRQFCDRVGLVAGVLYALHPALIRWSPEIIRDSTFWFLLSLSLYLLWRSLVEVRPGMYLVAVATIVVAAMTRCEGLVLAAPLIIWTWMRIRTLGRTRLPIRWAVLTGIVVVSLVVVGAGLAAARSGKAPIYTMGTLKLAQAWVSTHFRLPWLALPADDSIRSLMPGESVGRILEILIPAFYRGYTPVFGLLTLLGIGCWWRTYLRSDHLAVLMSALGLFTGMWIAVWCVHESSPRYVLSAMILGIPWPALGLLSLSQWCGRRTRRLLDWEPGARWASYVPLLAPVIALIASVNMIDPAKLSCEKIVGRWLGQQGHLPAVMVGPMGAATVVSYYSGVRDVRTFPWNSGDDQVLAMVHANHPDMVLLRISKRFTAERCQRLMAQMRPWGLEEIPADRHPEGCKEMYVLVRQPPSSPPGTAAGSITPLSLQR